MPKQDSLKERILSIALEKEEGVFPHQLAKIFGIKESTIRSSLSRLSKEGKLTQNFGGVFGCYGLNALLQKKPDGMQLPKLQNICAVCKLNKNIDSLNELENLVEGAEGIWTMRTIIGAKSGKVTIRLSGAYGFELPFVFFLLDRKTKELNQRFDLSLKHSDFILKNVEAFNDYYKIGISPNSINLSDFHSTIIKFYNKGNRLRVERRTSISFPLELLLQGFSDPAVLNFAKLNAESWAKLPQLSRELNSGFKSANYFLKEILKLVKTMNGNGTKAEHSRENDTR